MTASNSGCPECRSSDFRKGHQPLIFDALISSLFRCFTCGTLWNIAPHAIYPIAESDADDLYPGWRESEAWVISCGVSDVVEGVTRGAIDFAQARIGLLHSSGLHSVSKGILTIFDSCKKSGYQPIVDLINQSIEGRVIFRSINGIEWIPNFDELREIRLLARNTYIPHSDGKDF